MTMSYQQLSELCDSLDAELTDLTEYCQQLQDRVHSESMRSVKLNVLVGSLDKRIKQGYIH